MSPWMALVQDDKEAMDGGVGLLTPAQIKKGTGHTSECALFSLFLLREKHT